MCVFVRSPLPMLSFVVAEQLIRSLPVFQRMHTRDSVPKLNYCIFHNFHTFLLCFQNKTTAFSCETVRLDLLYPTRTTFRPTRSFFVYLFFLFCFFRSILTLGFLLATYSIDEKSLSTLPDILPNICIHIYFYIYSHTALIFLSLLLFILAFAEYSIAFLYSFSIHEMLPFSTHRPNQSSPSFVLRTHSAQHTTKESRPRSSYIYRFFSFFFLHLYINLCTDIFRFSILRANVTQP